jgi:hypothetical protein
LGVAGVQNIAVTVVITPLLAGAASLGGQRWGLRVGGWLACPDVRDGGVLPGHGPGASCLRTRSFLAADQEQMVPAGGVAMSRGNSFAEGASFQNNDVIPAFPHKTETASTTCFFM